MWPGLSMDGGGHWPGSPQGFALEQLAPVTCSISRTPGDHIASNTPDTPHYYHNGNAGSCAADDEMNSYCSVPNATYLTKRGFSQQMKDKKRRGSGMP